MAFPVEKVYVAVTPDSIAEASAEVVQNFAAATNQYDRDINAMICLAVVCVCLIVCVAVYRCFKVVSQMRMHAKEKDHELQLEKIKINEEIWELKKKLDVDERDRKRNKEEWDLQKSREFLTRDKEKAKLEILKDKEILKLQKEMNDLEHEKDTKYLELEKEKNYPELEKNLAEARAVIKTYDKCFDAMNQKASKNKESDKKS